MLTRAQGRAQRRALMLEIARAERRKKREHLAALRMAIREAKAARKRAIAHAVDRCRTARVEARAKAAALREKAFEELRRAVELERRAARKHCDTARAAAAEERTRTARARAELAAEQAFRREMRRIERHAKERHRELAAKSTARERRGESDDQVRANIPPELVYLFERIKSRIKPSAHWSRTEAFLHYAEEHPDEVLAAVDDKTEQAIAELERRERRLSRAPMTRAELAELVPF